MHRLRVLLRSLFLPMTLYCVAGTVAFYFVWHGVNGQRGLKIGEEYEQKLAQLRQEMRRAQQCQRESETRSDSESNTCLTRPNETFSRPLLAPG